MFYHIIDHNGFGTMHKLIMPLCGSDSNHKIVIYDNIGELRNIANDNNAHIIIHSTASKKSNFIYDFLKYFSDRQVYIFMHVSVQYELYKGRSDVINYLKYLCDNYKVTVLTPSSEVTKQYIDCGIKAATIQLGIDRSRIGIYVENNQNLLPYYGRIITTCSSDNDEYKYIKGIDLYQRFILENELSDLSLIAGTNNTGNIELSCKKFSEADFLNILAHSLMYVQFSRFESYNITAAYAKMFKVPTLLLNTEGTFSCMNGRVYNSYDELEAEALNILKGVLNYDMLEELYCDGEKRENLENFKESFEKTIRGYA